jgi:cellobionic acid phosphorylase
MNPASDFDFNETGDCFCLHSPRVLNRADFDLWNDSFCVTVDHTGRVDGRVFTPNAQPYAESLRAVYLVDLETGGHRSLTWGPVFEDPEVFLFQIHLDHLEWRQQQDGIASSVAVAVPRGANLEAWKLTLTNHSSKVRRLAILPVIPTGLLGLISHESRLSEEPSGIIHDSFPYYVKIPDHAKMARRWNTTFCFASRPPDSWTAHERDFLGFADWSNPQGLHAEKLGGRHVHYERGICASRYEITLQPGESFELGWIFGPSKNAQHAREVAAAYPPATAFSQALAEQRAFRESWNIPLKVKTPDAWFNHYINHWSPDRSIRIGRTFRFNPAPQARNAIQDTMTLAMFEPAAARERFLQIWQHQEIDGFMPHGLPMVPDAEIMPITLIPHKDTNVWGPLAVDLYLRETNDYGFLETEVTYQNGPPAPLADHLENGLRYLLKERSPRGLSLIGQGDWNDPLNMAGPEGRGESVWLTQALAFALKIWAEIAGKTGRDPAPWLDAAEECRENVRRHCWDGEWFLRATSDDGTLIGAKENAYGSIDLTAQAWAMMADIPDTQQIQSMIASVKEQLDNRIAPALLGPPYPGMVKHVGKLTLKSPGTGENGSIYSHAALFWSYALLHCGHADEGWRVLRNLIPGTAENPVIASGQVPLYIPNFYRGPVPADMFGQSSHAPNTGSAAWVYMTFIEQVIGLHGEGDHLRVCPNLPSAWDRVEGERIFRGTSYRFVIERDASVSEPAVYLNGKPCGDRIPWSKSAESIELRVILPKKALAPS